ncbi:TPA: hypothetical protein ACTZ5N_004192 [Bacillus cereus]
MILIEGFYFFGGLFLLLIFAIALIVVGVISVFYAISAFIN